MKNYPGDQILVGMLTFNRWKYTELTLKNLLQYTKPEVEIVIADNGSTDGTLVKLEQFLATARKNGSKHKVEILDNKKNIGIGKAMNLIFERSSRPLLVKLDNDILVQEDWLYYLWSTFNFFKDKFGVCCLEIRDVNGKPELPQCATLGVPQQITPEIFFEQTMVVNGATMTFCRSFWNTHRFSEERLYGHEDAKLVEKAAGLGLVCGQLRSPKTWATHLQGDEAYRKYDLWKLHTLAVPTVGFRKDVSCLPLEGDEIVATVEH